MKNAIVLDTHFGDDGMATAGKLLLGITVKRFEALEKQGLVREATPEEIEAGDQHAFEKDTSEETGDEVRLNLSINSAEVQELVDTAKREIDAALLRAEAAEKALAELRTYTDAERLAFEQQLEVAQKGSSDFEQALAELREKHGQTQQDLDASIATIEQLRGDLAVLEKGEKKQPAPANKKAAEPANKEG